MRTSKILFTAVLVAIGVGILIGIPTCEKHLVDNLKRERNVEVVRIAVMGYFGEFAKWPESIADLLAKMDAEQVEYVQDAVSTEGIQIKIVRRTATSVEYEVEFTKAGGFDDLTVDCDPVRPCTRAAEVYFGDKKR